MIMLTFEDESASVVLTTFFLRLGGISTQINSKFNLRAIFSFPDFVQRFNAKKNRFQEKSF